MRVFVLGGTGSIGVALVAELVARSHVVTGLSRSAASDRVLRALGATPLRGDLARPDDWAALASRHDAVIQVAATFDDDMAAVDAAVVRALMLQAEQRRAQTGAPLRVLYTGGCWLYGDTGGSIADEERGFDPLPAFSWMVEHAAWLLAHGGVSAAIVHPAMVYHEEGGVFARVLTALRGGGPVEIWGAESTRWPVIERRDLARAYCDLLERPDLCGHFNAAAQDGVAIGEVVRALCAGVGRRYDPVILEPAEVVARYGELALGPMLDQRMSAARLVSATGWQPRVPDVRAYGFRW